MIVFPSFFAVTSPVSSTDAIAASLLLHVTSLLDAFSGNTVAVNRTVSPSFSFSFVLFKVIPLTLIFSSSFFFTVISQLALTPLPFLASAVITALPGFWAVTRPVPSTVATPATELLHSISLFVASDGLTVAVSFNVSPSVSVSLSLFSRIPLTFISLFSTVISQLVLTPLPS